MLPARPPSFQREEVTRLRAQAARATTDALDGLPEQVRAEYKEREVALKQDSETRLAAFREKEAARVAAAEAEMAAESQRRVQELAVAAQERIARASQVDGLGAGAGVGAGADAGAGRKSGDAAAPQLDGIRSKKASSRQPASAVAAAVARRQARQYRTRAQRERQLVEQTRSHLARERKVLARRRKKLQSDRDHFKVLWPE